MADTADLASLPDYANPPVVETVLGVQFDRLPGMTNAHLGTFWRSLPHSEWPTVKDAAFLPPQFEQFGEGVQWVGEIQFQLRQDPASRLQAKNADNNRMIQIQNNRLHFNWLKKKNESYPRYESVRREFSGILRRFIEFVEAERLGEVRPNQWEVTYINTIPKGSIWNGPNEWGFFGLLRSPSASPAFGTPDLESFAGEWHFAIPERRGRLHVRWKHGLTTSLPPEERCEAVVLTLTARGPLGQADNPSNAVLEGLDLGHDTIVRSFKALMSAQANDYWGLRHD